MAWPTKPYDTNNEVRYEFPKDGLKNKGSDSGDKISHLLLTFPVSLGPIAGQGQQPAADRPGFRGL